MQESRAWSYEPFLKVVAVSFFLSFFASNRYIGTWKLWRFGICFSSTLELGASLHMCICKFGLPGFRTKPLASVVSFSFFTAFPLLLVGSSLIVVGGVAFALLLLLLVSFPHILVSHVFLLLLTGAIGMTPVLLAQRQRHTLGCCGPGEGNAGRIDGREDRRASEPTPEV